MHYGCEDCKNWEQENSDLRREVQDRDTSIGELEDKVKELVGLIGAWEGDLDDISSRLGDARREHG